MNEFDPKGFETNPKEPDGGYHLQQDGIIQDNGAEPDIQSDTPPQQETRYDINYAYKTGTYTYPTPPAKKKGNVLSVIIAAVLAAAIGAGCAVAVLKIGSPETVKNSEKNNSIPGSNVSINVDEDVSSIAEAVAKKCSQSVVGIRTTTSVASFFGGNQESSGEGSGVVYSADGYIITNYHVIEGAVKAGNGKIEVFLESADTKPYSAKVVGYHITSDLAVLKIKADNLVPVEFADSSKLSLGQYAVTIGAPGGLEFMGSVTYGIISGLDRVVSTSQSVSLIQTDAAINPGNSGGALLNSYGQLIGINSSKIVAEEFEGMGFAIPSNTVKEKVENIINKKDNKEAYIGITVSEKYTAEVLEFYGYPAGAVVLSVDSGSPAADAGIQRGDIITKFNGVDITEYDVLGELVNECEVGAKVEVNVYRSGRIYTTQITVASNN